MYNDLKHNRGRLEEFGSFLREVAAHVDHSRAEGKRKLGLVH